MKDKEYIRQWCLKSAESIINTHKHPSGVSVEEIVSLAKILEEYITDKKQPLFAVYPKLETEPKLTTDFGISVGK